MERTRDLSRPGGLRTAHDEQRLLECPELVGRRVGQEPLEGGSRRSDVIGHVGRSASAPTNSWLISAMISPGPPLMGDRSAVITDETLARVDAVFASSRSRARRGRTTCRSRLPWIG
jgi:hypothetical protein